jgi:WD40 repeat protein
MNAPFSALNTAGDVDPRLEQIIEAAVGRLQAGEAIDVDTLVAAHPEYAAELREILPTVARLARIGNPPRDFAPGSVANDDAGTLRQQIGEFRLIRELGRGGMGAVFEAEQLSMGRHVALKVLPFAAMVQEKSLQRFHSEVRAAAALDHPHIVSIYSVGEDRGVHFYAMQLVRGRTLADLIFELREGASQKSKPAENNTDAPTIGSASGSSTNRVDHAHLSTVGDSRRTAEDYHMAAKLGIQAAEALQHAHDMGVLHRDIKPSNLLLDRKGKLYVTDFGLARMEADAGMTMTGDIVGTLRYMAPEQVLANETVVDHRVDIYSLGATLYELLTLQPAFCATDRAKLLKQIAFDEPPPIRKLGRRAPAELETIVEKAMAKSRDERYETAQRLADDLRAFLEGRPIKARPISPIGRVRKWALRHQTPVVISVAALVVLSVGLAISMVRVKRSESRAINALEQNSDLLYTTDMSLAYQVYDKGWSDEVQTILDRHRPTDQQPDRRGFEWHLLQSLVKPPSSITLAGHKGAVNELAVFPDRQRLASVGDDGTLRIWDLQSRQLLQTISLCSRPLYSVAVSTDGRFVAAGSDILYLCDLSTESRISEVYQSEVNIESIAFSPDNKQLVVGSRYEEVCILGIDGQIVKRVPCGARLQSLEYLAGSPLLLVPDRRTQEPVGKIGFIKVWDSGLTKVKQELVASRIDWGSGITIARTSPCGRFVATGEMYRGKVFIFDLDSARAIAETPYARDRLTDLAYSPDGKAIALGFRNGRTEYFTLEIQRDGLPSVGRRTVVANAHQGEVTSVRFVNATSLATCGSDGLIRIWTIASQGATALNVSEQRLTNMQLSPNGELLLCTAGSELLITNLDRNEVVHREFDPDVRFTAPAWSPTRNVAAIGYMDSGSVIVLDLNGNKAFSISHGASADAIAFSPDGTLLAIISPMQLQMCRAENGEDIFRRAISTMDAAGAKVAFSHTGAHLAYTWHSGPVMILNVGKRQVVNELSCGSDAHCLAFSPDDAIIASGHGDCVIRLWDARTGRLLAEMAGHERGLNELSFSPDGHTLISAGNDGSVRIWSVDHRRCFGVVHRQVGPDSLITFCHLGLSSDGRRMVIGYETHQKGAPEVLVWDLPAIVKERID